MAEDVVKSVKVTFSDALPLGTHARFHVGKDCWIAYPAPKNGRILSLIDRLIGIHATIAKDMLRWINERPQDAEFITRIFERTGAARALHDELITEKTGATTE